MYCKTVGVVTKNPPKQTFVRNISTKYAPLMEVVNLIVEKTHIVIVRIDKTTVLYPVLLKIIFQKKSRASFADGSYNTDQSQKLVILDGFFGVSFIIATNHKTACRSKK